MGIKQCMLEKTGGKLSKQVNRVIYNCYNFFSSSCCDAFESGFLTQTVFCVLKVTFCYFLSSVCKFEEQNKKKVEKRVFSQIAKPAELVLP